MGDCHLWHSTEHSGQITTTAEGLRDKTWFPTVETWRHNTKRTIMNRKPRAVAAASTIVAWAAFANSDPSSTRAFNNHNDNIKTYPDKTLGCCPTIDKVGYWNQQRTILGHRYHSGPNILFGYGTQPTGLEHAHKFSQPLYDTWRNYIGNQQCTVRAARPGTYAVSERKEKSLGYTPHNKYQRCQCRDCPPVPRHPYHVGLSSCSICHYMTVH